MSTSYICLACRRTLVQSRPRKTVQLGPRANFISLSNRAPRTTIERNSGDDLVQPRVEGEGNNDSGRARKGKHKSKTLRESKSSSNALESLFQETLHPSNSPTEAHVPPSTVLELYKNVDTLKKLLLQGGNVADAWLFFVEHFGPDAEKHPFDKSLVSRALLKDVILAKRKHPLSESLPSVTEVSTISFQ